MKAIFIVLFCGLLLTSCDEPYILDANQEGPRVIIEGQVTNVKARQYVKVSRSSGFYDTGASPRITNALVTVSDDAGNTYNFVHNPRDHSDSSGYYLPAEVFIGEVGRTYSLNVSFDGEVYEAQDELYSVTSIDSLAYRIDDDEREDPEEDGKFYEVLIYAKEPQQTTDFYLFKFYRNDSLIMQEEDELYFADDEMLGETIDGIGSPIYFAPGDKAKIEIFSISRTAFVFYSDLQSLLRNDGGLFSQPPANSRNNLSNGALGFFQASALNEHEIEIRE
jgi:hypothetical protein